MKRLSWAEFSAIWRDGGTEPIEVTAWGQVKGTWTPSAATDGVTTVPPGYEPAVDDFGNQYLTPVMPRKGRRQAMKAPAADTRFARHRPDFPQDLPEGLGPQDRAFFERRLR